LDHFEHLKSQIEKHNINFSKYISKINILQEAYNSRFSEFLREESKISLLTNPFSIYEENIDALDTNIQTEVI
jgi:hypothetical protein